MSPDQIIILSYLAISLIVSSKDSFIASLAAVLCCLYASSDFFDLSTSVQVHLSYAIFYLIFLSSVKSNTTKSAMALMVVLNFVMAWDSYNNAKTETWLYANYAINTALIHVFIAVTLVIRRENIAIYNSIINYLRSLSSDSAGTKRGGQLSSREVITRNKRKASK